MRYVRNVRILGLAAAGMLAVSLGACSQSQPETAVSTPSIEEKTFQLLPAQATVTAGFLAGEFVNLRVSERVEQGTGKVVEAPKLLGSLKLKNLSTDQGARPVAGQVTYLDGAGQPIRLAEGRGEPSFTFPYYQDRLDPGATTTASLDVPFPAAALKEKPVGEVRLELSYIPMPIHEETLSVKVGLSAKH
ncbi:MAG TPA: hypothetical protein VLT62_12030 [Candidatus Methylomirabilis sp.]|nr:hypothetical protein [Candidatus Methylomirabilis sp.]